MITKSQAEFSAGTAVEGLQQAYQRGETDISEGDTPVNPGKCGLRMLSL